MTTVPPFDANAVRRYYDRHTARFLAWGQGGDSGAIHRAVWGPGVATREAAFRYVEDRIADTLRAAAPTGGAVTVADFGCGVGATLCSLAERFPALRGVGVTLSPLQARLARDRIAQRGLDDRIACREGDFCDLSLDLPVPAASASDLPAVDLIYAIESFVHGTNPAYFFIQGARRLRPGGWLIICDDLVRPAANQPPAAARTIRRFRRGWRINTLVDRNELRTLAAGGGFVHEPTVDLTPHLEVRRPRDHAIALLAAATRLLPFNGPLGHLTGGAALATGLQRGWLGYDLAIFRRGDD